MPSDLRRAFACLISSSSSDGFALLFDFFSALSLFECRFGDGDRLLSLVSCDLHNNNNMTSSINIITDNSKLLNTINDTENVICVWTMPAKYYCH